MAKKTDPTAMAVEALTRAVTDPTPLKLHGTKANPGIFLSSSAAAKSAAALSLERGWLEPTGEFVGKGKTAKETYRITGDGVEFALENSEVATVLADLLQASDGQNETLRRLEEDLGRMARTATAQNELLRDLRQRVRAPSVGSAPSGGTPPSSTHGDWHGQVVEYVRSHPRHECSFAVLYRKIAEPAGASIGQFHDGLRQLSRERRIALEPWTGAMSDLDDDHLALVLAKETKFYADTV